MNSDSTKRREGQRSIFACYTFVSVEENEKNAEVVLKKNTKTEKKIKNTNGNDNGKEKVGDVENGIERRTYFFPFH